MSELLGKSIIKLINDINNIDNASEYVYFSADDDAWELKTITVGTKTDDYWVLTFPSTAIVLNVLNDLGLEVEHTRITWIADGSVDICLSERVNCRVRVIYPLVPTDKKYYRYKHSVKVNITLPDEYFIYNNDIRYKRIDFYLEFDCFNSNNIQIKSINELIAQYDSSIFRKGSVFYSYVYKSEYVTELVDRTFRRTVYNVARSENVFDISTYMDSVGKIYDNELSGMYTYTLALTDENTTITDTIIEIDKGVC
jgi:hypothetical protein